MEKERVWQTDGIPTVYGYKNPASHSFFLSLFLRAGALYGDEPIAGITHFLEHITIRNIDKTMGGELYSTLDKNGIEFNASTYSEMVQFYISGATEKLPLAIEIILRILSPITLSADEIRREGDRIKAEIREGDERSSLATFTSAIVYEGTPLEKTITGTLGDVSKINKSNLEKYRKSVFTRDNIFFYLTGNFLEGDIERLKLGLWEAMLPEGNIHESIARVPSAFFHRTPSVKIKSADYTMLRMTFDIDMSVCGIAECDILYDMLLGGYNSRLYIELSEKRGLCYDVSGAIERYKNIGTFTLSVELKERDVYEALEIILSALCEMRERTFPSDALMRAGYVDNAYMLYDDARELNFTFAYDNHIMDEGYADLDQRRKRYASVTPEAVRETAENIFKRENMTVTLKGNKRRLDTDRINKILGDF